MMVGLPWSMMSWSVMVGLLSLFLFATATAQNSTEQLQKEVEGPERCLGAEAPLWCLAEEAGVGLAKALYSDRVSLAPGVFLNKGTSSVAEDTWLGLASSSLDLDLSALTTAEEGRGKKKRKYGYVLVALATLAAVLLPFKLKAIALMAATALFVGKLALVVASLIGLKKLVSKQSEETTHVHYGHRSDPEAHYLAYQEQIPQAENRY